MKGQKGYAVVGTGRTQAFRPLGVLCNIGRQFQRWWQLAEQRQRLAMLDDAALKDLGLSRADVMQESERPFWDDPLAR
ncbi:hypothetical protein DBR00_00080 [Pseudomonas sp. HMWF032]|uniref:DUF1127 domain-containing protein n=1 Tax=unclassified Pseudomonas TaxID=196821 RepID=UPI000D380970|nr:MULTISPECIES: DUF1127 domain-containing protein [unclassified Pseudomonas]PTS86845.1 hypothetical protein DBR00_00080 [Pseudomonas sp. HMWF032]PTT82459.1 hypothetical protein DBR41_13870 [Pseudomonas sp. HMWF010]WAC44511.1 DUF1127 domain-containing protein [Pseudomonas sp. SL4(2022)]